MKKITFILIFLNSFYVTGQNQTRLNIFVFLDIGVTANGNKANTLTVSTHIIDGKVKLERNDFGGPILRPLGFDMDSLNQRYSVTDQRTYKKILNF